MRKADKLKGTTIYLDFPSVGATEVIIMAASLAGDNCSGECGAGAGNRRSGKLSE